MLQERGQIADAVGSLEVNPVEGEHGLQTLLDGLLSMKAKHVIGYIRIIQGACRESLVPSALRTSNDPSSRSSGLGNYPPLAHRVMDHRALDLPPPPRVLLADYHHVGRDQKPAEKPSQAHHLPEAVVNLLLDHQEVEVASIIGITTSARSEHDHLRRSGCRLDQRTTGTLDRFSVSNSTCGHNELSLSRT